MTRRLYPALARWFKERFPAYTPIQKQALQHTLAGENTLILAPTGSGKTLAAFLSVLSALAARAQRNELGNTVQAVYVSPLKALDRDIHRNLEGPLAAINAALPEAARIRMEVRTGDTLAPERGRQQRRRPHLLLTTPESLSAILSQRGWSGAFAAQTVIVDEIHALAENKRGALLSLALERLESQSGAPLQRIGLSATAWPIDAVAQFLCGARPCAVAQVDLRRSLRLDIAAPPPDLWLPPAGYNPFRVAPPVADLVAHAHCTLAFTATRSAAERLALALKVLLPDWEEKIVVHHGSVDRDTRYAIEQGLAEGTWKAVVCSTSLELGVDFEAVDQVLLIGAPRGVSRALQRLGRSGHRVRGIACGALIPLSLPDLLQCVALRGAACQGRLDALRPPHAPLDVLAQALLGMSIERPWKIDDAFATVIRAGVYGDLSRADFDAVIEYLAGGGRVLGAYNKYGKITVADGAFQVASAKVARMYYMNTGVISDDPMMRVVTRTNRKLGEVEESFLSSLQPGEAFLIAGKTVALKRMHGNIAVVEPAAGQRVRTPRWMGGKMSLTAQLAHEELELRRGLRAAWDCGGADACIELLVEGWTVPEGAAERIVGFITRQVQAAPIPVDEPVQVEQIVSGRTLLVLFHVVAGRNVNRALAWVLAARVSDGGSVVANFDDHAFLLSLDARRAPDAGRLREGFNPERWSADLQTALEGSEMLGRRFRAVAETGQLLPRKSFLPGHGSGPVRVSSWSASLLYTTLREHEPEHPLVRETVREVLEDECDSQRAAAEAARIFAAPWEVFQLARPSPFALPLFTAFNRETLLAQDPDRAIEELAAELYEEWGER